MVWIVFGQTTHFAFVNFDDDTYIYKNPAITQGLNWQGVLWLFTHFNVYTWFPLTDLSHQINWHLYGDNAGGHHLTNVMLHAATAILLFLVLRKLTGAFWSAAFVAAVFAVHPLRVESVAWVVERKDVLSGFFFMATLWVWTRQVQNPAHAGAGPVLNPLAWTRDYYLALAFFVLGLMSKTMLVTMPFVLLLLDYWPLRRWSAGSGAGGRSQLRVGLNLTLEKTPFFVLSVAACIVTLLSVKSAMAITQKTSLPDRIGHVLLAYTDYLWHMIYPVGLTLAYAHTEKNSPLWQVGLSALILILITLVAVAVRQQRPWLLVGWFWYLGMFLPVIDIMQADQNVRADRYTYLPQIGLYIMLTWELAKGCGDARFRRVALGFIAACILTALTVAAHRQTSYWQNSMTLWTHALACKSDPALANYNLANALADQQRWEEATLLYQRSLHSDPDYDLAHINLGIALAKQNQPEAARQHFLRALQISPGSAEAHDNLGIALAAQNKPTEAMEHFRLALHCKPDYAAAHYDLACALAGQGNWTEAITHFEQAMHRPVELLTAKYIVAVALASHQKWGEAADLYEQVLESKPDFAEAHNNLGIALDRQGKSVEARPHFQQALALATAQGIPALIASLKTRLQSNPPAVPGMQAP